ncbi:MAG: hypothetical protein ACOYOA_07615 [Saprospiraceae bacterium]
MYNHFFNFEDGFANNGLSYRWTNANMDFDMPLKINLNGVEKWIYPKTDWQEESTQTDRVKLVVDRNFYVPVFYTNAK